jgi:pullulanase
MRRLFGGICVLTVALAAACSPGPATVDISPKRPKIYGLERAQRLTARILDKKGQQIPEATATWSSSDPAVVAVEPGGRIIAKKEGKAMVTAAYKKISAQIPVEVVDATVVEVSPPELNLIGPAGVQIPLKVVVKNSQSAPVPLKPTWESSDPKIATVAEDGTVTSVAPGKVTVIARVGDLQGASDVRVSIRELPRVSSHPIPRWPSWTPPARPPGPRPAPPPSRRGWERSRHRRPCW